MIQQPSEITQTDVILISNQAEQDAISQLCRESNMPVSIFFPSVFMPTAPILRMSYADNAIGMFPLEDEGVYNITPASDFIK